MSINDEKAVAVDGVNYVVRRMTPFVGSAIWQRLSYACIKLSEDRKSQQQPDETELADELMPDQRIRLICGMAFLKFSFADTEEVQRECMKVISRVDSQSGVPMPVMNTDGRWTPGYGLENDPALVTKLTVEALAYNLVGFLAKSERH